jgi:glycosyltransferase involved in cell wall biosynthesis
VSLEVVIFHPGVGEQGGVSVDVQNLVDGIERHGGEAIVVGRPRDVAVELARRPHGVFHVFSCLPLRGIFTTMTRVHARRRPLAWTPIFHPSRPRSWVGYGPLRIMQGFDWLAPHAARLADVVIAATRAEAEFFRRRGAPRVELIPPGVPSLPDVLSEDDLMALRHRLGLTRAPVVLTVARDNSRKGLPFGLATFAALRGERPDAQLLLVGPDPDHPAASLPGVSCPGWMTPSEIERAYMLADVLFVPSLYEGLPRAVIEAWRVGTPVVATDRIALAPLVENGAGHVVPYEDVDGAATALAQLLDEPMRAKQLGMHGRALVRDSFLLDRVVEETIEVYAELAA